jgi:hypothetical protein
MAIAAGVEREFSRANGVHPHEEVHSQSSQSSFPPWPDARERGRLAALLLALGCLCFFLFGASRGWSHNLSEWHGFRQTQTAISTYYMVHGPWSLAYETPVVGPPWSMPFEFPLYQWAVAATVLVSHLPLNQAGRLVSIAFFLLTLWPLSSILRRLNLVVAHRLVICALVLASPFYVFWSRAFMIESTALFLAVSYLALGLKAVAGRSPWIALAAAGIGGLGAAVKISTFLPFAVAVLAVLLAGFWSAFRQGQSWSRLLRYCGSGLLVGGTPVLALLLWTHFADSQKAENPIACHWTSQGCITWVFGTIAQRLSWPTWRMILHHDGAVIGYKYAVAIFVPGLLFGRRRLQIMACLLLFLIAPCVFTNVYYVHDYYTYGSAVLVLTGLGISLVSLLERGPWQAGVAACSVCMLLGAFVYRYEVYYHPALAHQQNDWGSVVSQVQRVTRPDETLLVVGYEWSSELPYYCERRAMMIPSDLPEIQSTSALFSVAMNYDIRHIVVRAEGHYNGFDARKLQLLANERGWGVEQEYQDKEFMILRLTGKPVGPGRLASSPL